MSQTVEISVRSGGMVYAGEFFRKGSVIVADEEFAALMVKRGFAAYVPTKVVQGTEVIATDGAEKPSDLPPRRGRKPNAMKATEAEEAAKATEAEEAAENK